MKLSIDPMSDGDWPAVRGIYGQGIETGNATFETEVPIWAEWEGRHLAVCRLVARLGSRSVGWAALVGL